MVEIVNGYASFSLPLSSVYFSFGNVSSNNCLTFKSFCGYAFVVFSLALMSHAEKNLASASNVCVTVYEKSHPAARIKSGFDKPAATVLGDNNGMDSA